MDKRLLIALLLTAIVIAVTPILFPTPRKIPSSTSSVPAVTSGVPTNSPASQTVSSPVSASALTATSVQQPVTRVQSRMDSAATTEAAITVPEQILPITTPRATYRFSSIGAGIVSATMNGYKNLATKKGDVELKLSGRPLLSLALVANRDTINLDRTAFQV